MARRAATGDGRYEPHETPPLGRAAVVATQLGLMLAPRLVLLPVLVVTGAGGDSALESRVVQASMIVSGVLMMLMMIGPRRIRTENLYLSMVDPLSLPFCILALRGGGTATLAALVVVTGLFQVLVGLRLSRLRRLITPAVSITIIVLALMSLVPVLADNVGSGQGGDGDLGAAVGVGVALAVMIGLGRWGRSLGRDGLRLWAAPLGLLCGIVVVFAFGAYDTARVREAPWFGLPEGGWGLLGPQGEDPFGPTFFALLPSFVVLGLVMVIRTHGSSIITQLVSWRQLASIDFREVQRANTRLGLGSVASALVGSVPLGVSPLGVGYISQTKCASRRPAAAAAGSFVLIAMVPKLWAAIIAVPRPLVVAYLGFILAPLVLRMIIQQRHSLCQARNLVLVGLPVLVGLIVELGVADFGDNAFWDAMTRQGLPLGSLLLVALALAFDAAEYRRRIETRLSVTSLGTLRRFVADFATHKSWNRETKERLDAVVEEALLVLTDRIAGVGGEDYRRLQVSATARGASVELEFVSGPTDAENLEDRLALLADPGADIPELEIERDVSLRMLRHHAGSVNHRQYHEAEIITATVAVEGDARA